MREVAAEVEAAHHASVDYAYVIGPDRLQVLTDVEGGWQPVADPAWTDTPDWDAIDRHAKQLRRQYSGHNGPPDHKQPNQHRLGTGRRTASNQPCRGVSEPSPPVPRALVAA
jgi:hypothetical protein